MHQLIESENRINGYHTDAAASVAIPATTPAAKRRATRKPASAGCQRRQVVAGAAPGNRRIGLVVTVALGCGIPLLSLCLSHLGGHLMTSSVRLAWLLGATGLALCISTLVVSLSHLAEAIADITHSPTWAAWCLAVTVDLSLVLCELVGVAGVEGTEGIRIGLMVAVTLASMALNCWAFLACPAHGSKSK